MIIGIIMRPDISQHGHKILTIYESIINKIYQHIILPIPILDLNRTKKYIDNCNGIILQGGNISSPNINEIINYIYNKDIPLLGICMGMQEMGIYLGGKLIDIDNHNTNKTDAHLVAIKDNTLLSLITNKKFIMVNSRHKEALIINEKYICAKSFDKKVEAICDTQKNFFLGLQWHPENLEDNSTHNIFEYFINSCIK